LLAQIFVPLGGPDAVQQNQVNVIRADFFKKTRNDYVSIGPFLFRYAALVPPDFADDKIFVALNAFQRGDQVRMRTIKVGEIEDPDASVVGGIEERLKFLLAHPGLV
jgi:hypothetical protein